MSFPPPPPQPTPSSNLLTPFLWPWSSSSSQSAVNSGSAAASQIFTLPSSLLTIPGTDRIPVIQIPTGQLVFACSPAVLASQTISKYRQSLSFDFQKSSFALAPKLDPSPSSINDETDVTSTIKNPDDDSEFLLNNSTSLSSKLNDTTVETPLHAIDKINSPLNYSLAGSCPSETAIASHTSTVVDGVNLEDMREFARQFKVRRLNLGLTQTQVGQQLITTQGPAYSQSAICRFEKLDITPKSAQKIRPVLEKWLAEAEEKHFRSNGQLNSSDSNSADLNKKRKRRTSFTPEALDELNDYFKNNSHPSGNEMSHIAELLRYDREVIRVWFCNKRQALKNTIKRIRSSADSKNTL